MNELIELYRYLMADDVAKHEDEIFKIIPELSCEKNFDQKSEWHSYDVWEHTVATINACEKNFENRLVMLLHDIGKPFSYQDDGEIRHFKNHALKSAEIAEVILTRLNIPNENKETILKLIKMHSSKIDIKDITIDDVDFYTRLLKIQKCDAMGYEKTHSLKIWEQLNSVENAINQIKNKNLRNDDEER